MTFISYAQNFEDVMLWRTLKHVKKGFYIDVGAAWPELDSVTNLFYINGWRGINIEPNQALYKLLREQRQMDINLPLAISDKPGQMTMNFVIDTGLSTLDDNIANMHVKSGWALDKKCVEVVTLETIWAKFVPENQEVHFLKIDIEGLEESALRGNDWKRNRPWIVVVEATIPMSQKTSHFLWENILLSADYGFVYADGLNRFYVAIEHPELVGSFEFPPNNFDEFVTLAQKKAENVARESQSKLVEMDENIVLLTSLLHELHESKSWKITAPLRWLAHQSRLLRQHGTWHRVKLLLKKILNFMVQKIVLFLILNPGLKKISVSFCVKAGIYDALKRGYLQLAGISNLKIPISNVTEERLNQKAKLVYADLKAARSGSSREKA